MSKGLGGLIVAMMVVEDMDRYVDKRRARRAERLALKTYRVRRWARLGERGTRVDSVGPSHAPAFPEP